MLYKSNLKKIRRAKKITQAKLAEALGKSRIIISHWENGSRNPCNSDIRVMANILGVGVEQISDIEPSHKSIFIDNYISQLERITKEYGKGLADVDIAAIKELKETVEGLRKENGRLKKKIRYKESFLDSIDSYTYVIDKDFKFIEVNSTFLNYLSKDESDVLNNSWSTFFSQDEIADISNVHREVFTMERRIKNRRVKLPKNKIGLLSIIPDDYDSYHNLSAAICIIKDITLEEELRKAKEQEEKEKAYLFECVNDMDSMFWAAECVDSEKNKYKYITVSGGVKKIYGLTKTQFAGNKKNLEEIICPNNIESVRSLVKNIVFPHSTEYKIMISGKIKWLQVRVYKKGNLLFGTTRDVTDQKILNDIRLLYKVINSMPNIVWIATMEPEFKYYFVSDAIEQFSGIPKQDFLENPKLWSSLRHPDDSGAFTDWNQHKECPSYYSYRIIRPDGQIRKIEEIFFRGSDFEGREIYYGILRDVSK